MSFTETNSAPAVKKALRQRMDARRRAQPPEEALALGEAAQKALLADPVWNRARQVTLYVAMRGEMPTDRLLEEAWSSGKEVLLPRCHPRRYGHMDFVLCSGREDLTPGRFGIWEPRPELPPLSWNEGEAGVSENERSGRAADNERPEGAAQVLPPLCPDVLILPGVAFDRQGLRLGFGGGYYDRVLGHPLLAASLRVGMAFSWQVIKALPQQLWDCHVNALCTEEGVLWL